VAYAGANVDLDLLQHGDQLVAVYSDILDNVNTSVCSANENRFFESNRFPDLTPTVDEVTIRAMRNH